MQTANDSVTSMVPTSEEMLEMLNVDVLPYFDDYDAATFCFSAKYRAVKVVADNPETVTFLLDNDSSIKVSQQYFKFPGAQKEITIHNLKNQLA